LCYKYGLPGYQVVSYKQKKGKGFQKKHNANITTRILGTILRLDLEGWEYGIQLLAYQEYESLEPESDKDARERSSRLEGKLSLD
jgi:hypothetical protein